MIAARQVDRLEEAAEEMMSLRPPGCKGRVELEHCNIRNEKEVK